MPGVSSPDVAPVVDIVGVTGDAHAAFGSINWAYVGVAPMESNDHAASSIDWELALVTKQSTKAANKGTREQAMVKAWPKAENRATRQEPL